MANPTTNFGWVMPTSSSLVTNLPADFNTFGQAVDTSMSELLGGTTGQVLSKTSNTNMDFTWVTPTDQTPLTTKGDLFTFTTVDARLAVGNNGETLVADSSTSTGLRYQASMAAGKNAIINGGMDIWQRGTSSVAFTTAYTAFSADRFVVGQDTAANGSATQVTTSLQGTFSYGLKMQRTAASTSTNTIRLVQALETQESVKYAGQTVTFSFYAKAGANYSASSSTLSVYVGSGTGTNQSPAALVSGWTGNSYFISNGTATLTTSWQRFTFTGTVSSSANQIGFQLLFAPTGTAGADDSYSITGIQLELGSVATTFTRAGGTLQGELAACQRYYYRITTGSPYDSLSDYCTASAATRVYVQFNFPTIMRVAPTALDYSATSTMVVSDGANNLAITSFTNTCNNTRLGLINTVMATGTQYRGYQIAGNNTTGAYIGFSAEL